VHLNPVRIKNYAKRGIEEKIKIVKEYVWSSYAGYCNVKKRQGFVDYRMIVGMLSKKDDSKGRKVYEQFVYDGILKDMNITFWEDVKGQAVLGTESFVDFIYERFLADRNIDKKEQTKIKELTRGPETPEEIAKKSRGSFLALRMKKNCFKSIPETGMRDQYLLNYAEKHLGAKISKAELGRQIGNMSGAAINETESGFLR